MNKFAAAVLLKMSPALLDWLTKNAPKKGEDKKLPFITKESEKFFCEQDLKSYSRYLTQPWPSEVGKRPSIPAGISREIKIETGYKCAICGHPNGEYAHIDPVHNSKNNHPHNLIYLCPNHHDEYDNKKTIDITEIKAIKKDILETRVSIWRAKSNIMETLLSLISELKTMKQHAKNSNKAIYPQLINDIVAAVGIASPKLENKAETSLLHKLKVIVSEQRDTDELIKERKKYLNKIKLSDCPLCLGNGIHNQWQCPVCSGNGTIDSEDLDGIDLSSYEQLKCPLCKGSGVHNEWECPVCRGMGTVDSEGSEEIDLLPYEQVECPLCEGSGIHNEWTCPICRGVGTVDSEYSEEIDLSSYEQIECPLCKGRGVHNEWECRICRGVGTIDSEGSGEIDLSAFEQVKCPLCKGRGVHNEWECRICRGMGTIDSEGSEEIDISAFEQVKCPLCKGRGVHNDWECRVCRGVGTIDSEGSDEIDLSSYDQVECPLCEGRRIHNEWECPACRGVGTVDKEGSEDIDLSLYERNE